MDGQSLSPLTLYSRCRAASDLVVNCISVAAGQTVNTTAFLLHGSCGFEVQHYAFKILKIHISLRQLTSGLLYTKPEIRNISQCWYWRTKPRLQTKFGKVQMCG